jgi:hypothetical protein
MIDWHWLISPFVVVLLFIGRGRISAAFAADMPCCSFIIVIIGSQRKTQHFMVVIIGSVLR